MKLVDLKVNEFVNEVDSNSPAPGGGSVAALAGSLGSSLSRMVGHLTVTKKKFKALDEEKRIEFNNAVAELESVKERLVELIDEDTEAFNLIMAAFKLPKVADEEKAMRKDAIEKATITAIEVPLSVARLCKKGMHLLPVIKEYGNKNCLSDLGVSMLMLYSGLVGACMNVKINIPGISDDTLREKYQNEMDELMCCSYEKMNGFTKSIFSAL